MIWLKCRSTQRPMQLAAIRSRVETISDQPEFLLVADPHTPLDVTVWLRLADGRYRTLFPEFKEARTDDLPKKALLMVGDQIEFEKLFAYAGEQSSGGQPPMIRKAAF